MKITDIVILLLFVIPGILTEKIINALDMPNDHKKTEFSEIVNGIILSLPIIFLVCLFTNETMKFSTIQQYIDAFNNITFLLDFACKVILISIILGVFLGIIKDYALALINLVKKYLLRRLYRDDKTVWRKILLDKRGCHFIEVFKNGELLERGFVEWCSAPGQEKELTFTDRDLAIKYSNKFTFVKSKYINLEQNIVINDYDTKDYIKFCYDTKKCKKHK